MGRERLGAESPKVSLVATVCVHHAGGTPKRVTPFERLPIFKRPWPRRSQFHSLTGFWSTS